MEVIIELFLTQMLSLKNIRGGKNGGRSFYVQKWECAPLLAFRQASFAAGVFRLSPTEYNEMTSMRHTSQMNRHFSHEFKVHRF